MEESKSSGLAENCQRETAPQWQSSGTDSIQKVLPTERRRPETSVENQTVNTTGDVSQGEKLGVQYMENSQEEIGKVGTFLLIELARIVDKGRLG
jgi:hypothetical protein